MLRRLFAELLPPRHLKESPVAEAEMAGAAAMSSLDFGNADKADLASKIYKFGIVQAAVERIASATGGAPWQVTGKDGAPVENGELAALLAAPNSDMDWRFFIHMLSLNFAVFGDAYVHVVRRGGRPDGAPLEVWPLQASKMTVKVGRRGEIDRYEYGGDQMGGGKKEIYKPGDGRLIHIRRPNLNSSTDGATIIHNAISIAEIVNMYSEKLYESLQGGVNSPAVLVVNARDKDAQIGRESVKKIKKKVRDFVTGGSQSGTIMTMFGVDAQKLELNRKSIEADDMNARDSIKREVCFLLGIPPVLLGLKDDSTYNNYQTALTAFYTDTVLPHYTTPIGSALTRALAANGEVIGVNEDTIPALAEARMARIDKAAAATFLTINEQRAMAGYPPVEGGDVVLTNASLVPLADATAPAEAVPPAKAAELWAIDGGKS